MLNSFIHALAQYKLLSLILLIAVILAVFGWVKALRASRRHNAERENILAKLREEEALRRRFAVITPSLAEQSDASEMLHGVALRIQKELDGASQPEPAFRALPEAKQFIYALNFVFCEDADTLSGFFRLNGKPLTTAARDAARQLFDETTLPLFETGYKMFDDEDETTSSMPDDVAALDQAFAAADKTPLFENVRAFILSNAALLSAPESDADHTQS